PDHDRERRVPAHARHEASDVGGERLARARHAGERYAVHEAARERDEPSEAFVAGRRRVQVGPREPLRIERRVELSRLFGRKIGNDDPGDAGLRRIARERGEAARIAKERIRVTHEEHRGVSLPRESTGLGDASGKSGPAPQRDLARALHRRAIRERVAERDAELEHVRTGVERLAVGARDIPYATAACERRVLRSDAWIVEPRRDRVGLADLAVLVLKDERARAVEHAHLSADDRRRVMPGLDALATRLDAD